MTALDVVEVVKVEHGDGRNEKCVDEGHLKEVVAKVILRAHHANPPEIT